MIKKNSIYLLLLIITLLISPGCGLQQKPPTSHSTEYIEIDTQVFETETVTEETKQPPEILHFVDAHGEWFETEINPKLKTHPYNWDHLINDETGIFYEDEHYRIRHGIDVSKWQGTINWEKVKSAGYDFVIIRLGYRGYGSDGAIEIDTKFYNNIHGAQSAGLDVGVYFFSQAINETEALEEANFVLQALDGYELQLPIVYDPELIKDRDARTNDVSGEQFTKNTIIFCEAVKSAGYEPMIYSNMIWEAFLFDMSQLECYPFWYADYETIPQTPYHFVMWQYTETGIVDGISGNVDLNILFEEIE